MGFTYEAVDRLLYRLVDGRYTPADLQQEGFSEEFVKTVMSKIRRSQYKRRMPILARIAERTIEGDFLYPRDWGV
jgi:NAD+ synthase